MTFCKTIVQTIFIVGCTLLLALPMQAQDTISTDIQQRYQQGLTALNSFQFEQAIPHFYECHRAYNDNLNFLQQLGYCYFKIGNYRDAKLFFNKMLKLDSTSVQAFSYLGAIAEQTANYHEARSYYGELLGIDSTNSYYYKQNAYMCLKTGDVIPGIAFFLKAHELNPMDIEVIERLSAIYLELEQPGMAEQMLAKGLNLDAKNIRLLQLKARIQNKLKNYEDVIASIVKTMDQGDTTSYYQMMLGVAYMRLDSVEQGIYHLEAITERGDDNEHTHHYLGTGYRQKGELEKSQAHYEKAIELGISPKIALYYEDLAAIYEEQGDYKKAIAYFEKSYEHEADAELLFHLARNHDLYYKDKRMAMRYYEQYSNTDDKKYQNYTAQRMEQLKEIIHFYK